MSISQKLGNAAIAMGLFLGLILLRQAFVPALTAAQSTAPPSSDDGLKHVGAAHSFTIGDALLIVRVMEGSSQVLPPEAGTRWPLFQEFQSGADWMKNLTFVVRNLSQKEMTSIGFGIALPQTGYPVPEGRQLPFGNFAYEKFTWIGQRPARYVLNQVAPHAVDAFHPAPFNPLDPYGHHPAAITTEKFVPKEADAAPPLSLSPGHELEIHLAPFVDEIKSELADPRYRGEFANAVPFSSITTVWIELDEATFTDRTRWSPGEFYRPDPSFPGKYAKWMPITLKEFNSITATQ